MFIELAMYRFSVKLNNGSTSAFLDALKANIHESVQLVVCILPSNKKDLYDAIKKQCCTEQPIPSQCVTNGKLRNDRGLMSVVSKIAIQINVKLGGEAWALEVPVRCLHQIHPTTSYYLILIMFFLLKLLSEVT